MGNNTLTSVPGIRVGQVTHLKGATGCTVVLCPDGTVGGVDQRGGGPATRETDLMRPLRMVESINAVLIAGGSAFGLAAADGVMRYLEEKKVGFPAGEHVVPIVPSACLFDLGYGEEDVRPDADMGYAACEAATDVPVEQGTVGAGAGCTVGKLMGPQFISKGGIGSASVDLGDGLIVAALVAVNPFGEVIDEKGDILAGARNPDGSEGFAQSLDVLKMMARMPMSFDSNTVIGIVATNAKLSKDHINKVAQMAQDGVARAVRPAHTMFDGDTIFALATGEIEANVNVIGAFAAEIVAEAIRNGIRSATSLAGVPSINK